MTKENILTKIYDYINNWDNVACLMDHEILVKVKYRWQHSRGHAKMYACPKIIGCRTNSYGETDLNAKTEQSQRIVKYKSNMDDCIEEVMLRCTMCQVSLLQDQITEKPT